MIIELEYRKDRHKCFEMLAYCNKTFGPSTDSTWRLRQLAKIQFYDERYYTMFILKWGI